jgi:hypothetical protein
MVKGKKFGFGGLGFGKSSIVIYLIAATVVIFIAFIVMKKSKKTEIPSTPILVPSTPTPTPTPIPAPPVQIQTTPPPPSPSPPTPTPTPPKGNLVIRSGGYLPFGGGKYPVIGRAMMGIVKNNDGTNNFDQSILNTRVSTNGTPLYVSIKNNGEATYYGKNSDNTDPLETDYIADSNYSTFKLNK